jgi:undecaprenyl-diphosphatase
MSQMSDSGAGGGASRSGTPITKLAGAEAGRARHFWHPANVVALIRGRPLLAASALLTVLFVLLTAVVLRADLQPTPWDIYITRAIQALPAPLGLVLEWVSFPGFSPQRDLIVAALLGFMWVRRRYAEAVFTALAAGSGLVAELVKVLVDRPRPTPDLARVLGELHTYSFPSGHVTGYTALCGFLFYLAYTLLPRTSPFRWCVLVLTGLLIVLVGPSRVYMGQHWASDALGGYALGFAYLLPVIEGYRLWLASRVRRARAQPSARTQAQAQAQTQPPPPTSQDRDRQALT